MTLIEAITEVLKMCPAKSVCATKSVWHHDLEREIADEYRISILPGIDGGPCDLFTGQSPEQCLKQIASELPPPVAEPNVE